jgi:hypothetical protein
MNDDNVIKIPIPQVSKRQVAFVLIVMCISFLAGSWWTKNQYLQKIKELGIPNTVVSQQLNQAERTN